MSSQEVGFCPPPPGHSVRSEGGGGRAATPQRCDTVTPSQLTSSLGCSALLLCPTINLSPLSLSVGSLKLLLALQVLSLQGAKCFSNS